MIWKSIDKGANLDSPYNQGLNPASVWPNAVGVLNQDVYGTGWEIGAYVYVTTVLSPVDLNQDGRTDIQDIQGCVNHILRTQDWGTRADVNNDGAVNILDVQEIVNAILDP